MFLRYHQNKVKPSNLLRDLYTQQNYSYVNAFVVISNKCTKIKQKVFPKVYTSQDPL